MPRTFTALAAAEVKGHHHHHNRQYHHHHHHHHQVGGESVLMVVGGDNLADNQESSMEIYNRFKFIMICIADNGGGENDGDDDNEITMMLQLVIPKIFMFYKL